MMTNKTLQQILDVLKYSKYNYGSGKSLTSSYQDAISRVANEYGVTYQTIGDGCRRRLKLDSIGEFSELVRKWFNGNTSPLINVLKSQTSSRLHSKIENFFDSKGSVEENNILNEKHIQKEESKMEFNFEIKETDRRYLKALSEIEGVDEKDLINNIVSDGIKDRMKKAVQNLK